MPNVISAHMDALNRLIDLADAQGKWLCCHYQDTWFSPTQLREQNRNGKFRWSVENWILKDPRERLIEALIRADAANTEANRIAIEIDEFALGRRASANQTNAAGDLNMTHKQTIPHPSEAKSDEDHIKFAQHALAQVAAGHYKLSNISATQETLPDGGVRITASVDRHETDPSIEASPHEL